jgi:hypothetical protein
MTYYDGMILTDAEADDLPDWMTDDNATLHLVASSGAPTPDYRPTHIWQLEKTGAWPNA